MVAALRTAAGKQPSCRFVALGTRPAMEEHWFARMLAGGADYTQCHAAAAEDDPLLIKTWRKANPSLSRMPDLRDSLKVEAKEARRDPAALAMFKALRLNLGTYDTRREFLVAPDAWARAEGDLPRKGELALGLDLGSGASMSASKSGWMETVWWFAGRRKPRRSPFDSLITKRKFCRWLPTRRRWWGGDPEMTRLIGWFLATEPPARPFKLAPGVTVIHPGRCWEVPAR